MEQAQSPPSLRPYSKEELDDATKRKFEKIMLLLMSQLDDHFIQMEDMVDRLRWLFYQPEAAFSRQAGRTPQVILGRASDLCTLLSGIEATVNLSPTSGRVLQRSLSANFLVNPEFGAMSAKEKASRAITLFLEKIDIKLGRIENSLTVINTATIQADIDRTRSIFPAMALLKDQVHFVLARAMTVKNNMRVVEDEILDVFLETMPPLLNMLQDLNTRYDNPHQINVNPEEVANLVIASKGRSGSNTPLGSPQVPRPLSVGYNEVVSSLVAKGYSDSFSKSDFERLFNGTQQISSYILSKPMRWGPYSEEKTSIMMRKPQVSNLTSLVKKGGKRKAQFLADVESIISEPVAFNGKTSSSLSSSLPDDFGVNIIQPRKSLDRATGSTGSLHSPVGARFAFDEEENEDTGSLEEVQIFEPQQRAISISTTSTTSNSPLIPRSAMKKGNDAKSVQLEEAKKVELFVVPLKDPDNPPPDYGGKDQAKKGSDGDLSGEEKEDRENKRKKRGKGWLCFAT